jgi:hypothetical protein
MAKLKADGAVAGDDKSDDFSWIEVIRCLQSVHVWLLAPVLFFIGKRVLFGLGVLKRTLLQVQHYIALHSRFMVLPSLFILMFVDSLALSPQSSPASVTPALKHS